MMNDDFLSLLREPPRREFANALYERISQPRLAPAHSFLGTKRIALVVAIAFFAFGTLFALSPEVRAQTGVILRKIGELTFTNAIPRPQTAATIPVPLPPFPYYGRTEGMTVDQARTAVPFAFHMPTWVPADYYIDDQVGVQTTFARDCNCEVGRSVSKQWVKTTPLDLQAPYGGMRISVSLTIYKGIESTYPTIYETDLTTLEQLNVNGRPTALLGEGGFPHEPRASGLSKALMWTEEGVTYVLRGTPGVPVEDLIHMAESIP